MIARLDALDILIEPPLAGSDRLGCIGLAVEHLLSVDDARYLESAPRHH